VKTLHLTNAYHPTSGGIRHFYDALLRSAGGAGIRARLVVPADESSVEDLGEHARIYRIRAPRAMMVDPRYRMLLPTHMLGPHSPIRRILRDEQPDLVEVCDKYSLCYLAGVLRKGWLPDIRRPVLVGLSCERMDDNVSSYLRLGWIGDRLSALYMRRVYLPQFDHHVANSSYTAGELRRQSEKHQRPVQILPMGVEIERFGPHRRSSEARRQLLTRIGGSDATRVLVYAGRLAPEKNVWLLPDVLERLARVAPDYRLVIAGDGTLMEPLKRACAAKAPGRAHFVQFLDREALADLLSNADVFVHPNPREPFGIGPLEAMASGLPLVAPTTGGVTTYASDDSAWLAAPDVESFAARIREVVADSGERCRRIARAQAVAREYGWDAVAHRFFTTYLQLVRNATGSSLTRS
jgi:alpha-1,6-mannosyltransferase